jgi:hypothetical protein
MVKITGTLKELSVSLRVEVVMIGRFYDENTHLFQV